MNKCELKFNDLLDENENLRERLGLDPREPVDVSEFRKDKDRRKEETKALNIILQKEVGICSVFLKLSQGGNYGRHTVVFNNSFIWLLFCTLVKGKLLVHWAVTPRLLSTENTCLNALGRYRLDLLTVLQVLIG